MNIHGRMMNKEGFVCKDDTMKEYELNLEKKKVSEKFSLCIHQSIKKRLQELLYIQAKL